MKPSESRIGRLPHPLNRGAIVDPSNRQVPKILDGGQLEMDGLDELLSNLTNGGEAPGVVTLLGKTPQMMTGRLSTTDVAVLAALCANLEIPDDHPEGAPLATRSSIKRLARATYGYHGGEQHRVVRHALVRLLWTMFTIPGMDRAGRVKENGGTLGLRCLGGVEWYGQDLHVASSGEQSLTDMAATVDRVDPDAPLDIVIEPWLVGILRRNQAARLDLALLQLMGRGLAARVWMFLEAERYERVVDPHEDGGTYGRSWVDLAPPAMATFGLDRQKHVSGARRDLRNACARILGIDPGYRRLEVVQMGRGRYRLIVERWEDAVRRRRLHFPQDMSGATRRATRRDADEQATQARKARRALQAGR